MTISVPKHLAREGHLSPKCLTLFVRDCVPAQRSSTSLTLHVVEADENGLGLSFHTTLILRVSRQGPHAFLTDVKLNSSKCVTYFVDKPFQ